MQDGSRLIFLLDVQDKAEALQQHLEQLFTDQQKYKAKYDSLYSVVNEGQDLFFQQNIANELRNVDDHIDTLEAALDYIATQVVLSALQAQERSEWYWRDRGCGMA